MAKIAHCLERSSGSSLITRISSVALVYSDTVQHPLSGVCALRECSLFGDNLANLATSYKVKSTVSVDIFRQFVSDVQGKPVEIAEANVTEIRELCDEFGFQGLRHKLARFHESPARTTATDTPARARVGVLEEGFETLRREVAALQNKSWTMPLTARESLIVKAFPPIFADFQGHHFELLWRGTRDGFGASVFHRQCEGHANTLTVIRDTDGNIFGGFTPLTWESTSEMVEKADGSLRSFIFTLKNPHNVAARKFDLKAEQKNHAIECCRTCGPRFWDINVCDNCNAHDGNRFLLHATGSKSRRLKSSRFHPKQQS
jgi:hypothetical protein